MSRLGKRAIPILIITMFALSIIPIITVNAVAIDYMLPDNSGVYGDTIEVYGYGVTAGMNVNLYWDAVKAWDGTKGLLNSTEAESSGDFEVWFDVPKALGGAHYLWVKDTDTGETASMAFTVNPIIKFSPSSGLPLDKITVKGYAFSKEADIVQVVFDYGTYTAMKLTLTPLTPTTDTLGYWEATFKVPSNATYATHTIRATDENTIWAEKTFKVGASITLEYEAGPVGSIVEIKGRGFDPAQYINAGDITLDDHGTDIDCFIFDEPVDVEGDKEFTLDIVIPQVSKKNEDYTITVQDGTFSAEADFNVTALAKITTDPEYGVQGYRVNIEGSYFIKKSGETVTLELWPDTYPVGEKAADIKELETESDGTFTGTFTVPAVSSGNYVVVAMQEDYNIDDDAGFRVGMIIVILSKTSGPSGTHVTMTGTGFTPNEAWNATFGDLTLVEDGDVQPDGDLELNDLVPSFFVPTVDPGTYTITVLDIEADIEVTVEFEVTEKTEAWTTPMVAPNGYNVTIEGQYFSEEAGWDVTFVLYNVTSAGKIDEDWDITADVTWEEDPVQTDEDGEFKGYWGVYDSDTLSLGEYWLNVTDENDLFAQYLFEVVSKTVQIDPRKSSFKIGETVGFKVECSFSQIDSYIEVMEPEGDVYWTTDPFAEDLWIKVGTVMRVPFYSQTAGGNPMMLLEDAPLGTWSWTWYDVGDDKKPYTDDDEEIDSGTFTVEPAAEAVLGEQLNTLQGTVTQLTTNFNSLSGTVGTLSQSVSNMAAQVTSAAQAANAANQAVTNLSQTVSEIAQTANSAKTSADAAKTSADAAKTSAEAAQTAASGLTTLVYGAIGASLVAALAAIVSLMQISRRIAG